jgi:hypothetical protein
MPAKNRRGPEGLGCDADIVDILFEGNFTNVRRG